LKISAAAAREKIRRRRRDRRGAGLYRIGYNSRSEKNPAGVSKPSLIGEVQKFGKVD